MLLKIDAEVELMLQEAEGLEARAAQVVERADDDASEVCVDARGCTSAGLMAADSRTEALALRDEAHQLRERATHLREERAALAARVFGAPTS